ncbi:hypothetical protein J2Y48_004811 [Mycoplana sp. BE70]|uniref:hypothetical protein n=1 Tax=Mycoplana sp. BE70 TaxID=2817775 RepID=UPI002858E7F6|nr:hypothetical protein [Mycoplana sp. BE70]MDR6759495.1 hypothetical protein [Mycoplana sp. BE70]
MSTHNIENSRLDTMAKTLGELIRLAEQERARPVKLINLLGSALAEVLELKHQDILKQERPRQSHPLRCDMHHNSSRVSVVDKPLQVVSTC